MSVWGLGSIKHWQLFFFVFLLLFLFGVCVCVCVFWFVCFCFPQYTMTYESYEFIILNILRPYLLVVRSWICKLHLSDVSCTSFTCTVCIWCHEHTMFLCEGFYAS